MINLGKKQTTSQGISISKPSKKVTISYPEFYIDDIELPLGSDEVGKIITAVVQLKVKKAGAEIGYDNKKSYRALFSVIGIDFGKRKVDFRKILSEDLDIMEQAEYTRLKRR